MVASAQHMALKHLARLNQCPDQPCPNMAHHAPRTTLGFRFMHSPATEDDFVPPAEIDGPRPRDKCGRFALSFFTNIQAARWRYAKLAEREDAASRYGGSIGEITLLPGDGLQSLPGHTGHFDLHQEDGVLFAARVIAYHAP